MTVPTTDPDEGETEVEQPGVAEPPVAPEGPDEPEPDTFPRAYVEQLRAEAAGYRTRAQRADELHRRLVETTVRSAAADHLADPADLLVFGVEADLLDTDGFPDADLIVSAARTLAQARPHLAPRRPTGDIGQGATVTADRVDLAALLRARAS